MSTLGTETCALACAVASAVLFARLTRHCDRPWLTALSGAFFWAANVVSGRLTFALGAVTALAALTLLRRPRWAVLLAGLTGLLSPVAAAFLGFAAAVLVLRRCRAGWLIGAAATAPVVVLAVLFPGGGIQPMSPGAATPGVLVGLVLAVLSTHPLVRLGALLYAVAVGFFLLHEDPFGSNVLRLGLLLAVPVLLATTGRRTPVVVALAACGFLAWQLDPLVGDLRSPGSPPFAALTRHLDQVGAQRVEVLAGRDHREASEVVESVALARGWARQIDVRDNPLFYRPQPLQQSEYVAWLRQHAVDRVVVPRRGPLDFGSVLEADLLRRPVAGLEQEWSDRNWTVYRVVETRPVVGAPAQLVSYERSHLLVRSPGPATVAVDVRWSRWLSVSGPGCLDRDGDRVVLRFAKGGVLELTSSLRPRGRC